MVNVVRVESLDVRLSVTISSERVVEVTGEQFFCSVTGGKIVVEINLSPYDYVFATISE